MRKEESAPNVGMAHSRNCGRHLLRQRLVGGDLGVKLALGIHASYQLP